MSQYDTHAKDNSRHFDEPIKVRWTGRARGRISEYNRSYSEENADNSVLSPERFCLAVNRQKTNIVIATVDEANAVHRELKSYHSDQRTWMNSSMDRAISRIKSEISEEMKKRGYEPVHHPTSGFREYLPANEAVKRREEIEQHMKKVKAKRDANEDLVTDVYAQLENAKNYAAHTDHVRITMKKNLPKAEADKAKELLSDAGCHNVEATEEEYTESSFMSDETETYTVWKIEAQHEP
jgi:hypothetical protein